MISARRMSTCGAVAAGLLAAAPSVGAQTPGVTCNLYGPRHTCEPYLLYPLGQDLRLTVQSAGAEERQLKDKSDRLDTLGQLFAALRACWTPPPGEDARPGMEVSIRLSFDRGGNILGEPRFTYTTHGVTQEQRNTYRRAVVDSLNRCTPLPLSAGLGGAIAGRPLSIRFIDNRKLRGA
jgi:hypothetical protein